MLKNLTNFLNFEAHDQSDCVENLKKAEAELEVVSREIKDALQESEKAYAFLKANISEEDAATVKEHIADLQQKIKELVNKQKEINTERRRILLQDCLCGHC